MGGFAVGGQQKMFLRVAYDKSVLPLRHLLARLYLEEAHKIDHAGVDVMIMRSQSHVWITRVRQKAKAVKACFACRRQAKKLAEQKTAPLRAHRLGLTPSFWSTAVDLLGPLLISGPVNKLSIMVLHLLLGRASVE
jgi:hypothetical protein